MLACADKGHSGRTEPGIILAIVPIRPHMCFHNRRFGYAWPVCSFPSRLPEFPGSDCCGPRDPARPMRELLLMATGTVKFFNTQKGFGFIQPDDGSKDVFVHISAVERAGMRSLNEGQRVQFDVQTDRGKLAAGNLQAL